MVDSQIGSGSPPLVTGKLLEDRFAEASQDVGSLPINIISSPDGQYALTTDAGFHEAVWAIRISDGKGTGNVDFGGVQPSGRRKSNGLYYGLAIGPDNTVYAAQGHRGSIAVLQLNKDGSLSAKGTISGKSSDFPAGLALDDRGLLYVANNDPTGGPTTFEAPASVAIFNVKTGKEVGRFKFDNTIAGTSNFPLAVAVLRDGSKCYVSSQRDSCVYVLQTADPTKPTLHGTIASGSHPDGLIFNRDQSRLFIANAHSDTISFVNTEDDAITATVLLRPEIARNLPGATPTGMALSPDEKTLYAALGDMNAVGVVDVSSASLLGYVAAGWYPTGVVVAPDGKRLLVANAKGIIARHPNPAFPAPGNKTLQLLEGDVTIVAAPKNDADLKERTERVLELNRLIPRFVKAENPLKDVGLAAGKITHVIYIIKENRTYDQVLGDMPQGNGDPKLVLFGKQVTPNLHAIADRFVLLDNFYACGEVSGDGWVWSTQGQANEYTIKNVPYQYSHRGRTFDYEGTNNDYPTGGFPAVGPDGKPLSDDPKFAGGAKPVPDVAEGPGKHIWDDVLLKKLTYRNYGFFENIGVEKDGKVIIPGNYPSVAALQPPGHDLAGVSDIDFRKFDLEYADGEAPSQLAQQMHDSKYLRPVKVYGKYHATCRFDEWNREFQMMLAKDPTGAAVPNFMTVRLGDDHTMGANADMHTPRSMVADNDYAVGELVAAVSHSPIWKSTAILIVEDDAQNGPDHVDCHRSTAYVISPWIKAHSVDHSFQNSTSILKTIECLLDLPPMNQYDAVATPVLDWDSSPSNGAAYEAIMPDAAIIAERNAASNQSTPVSPEEKAMLEQSKAMDFTVADRAPAEQLNRIIWQTVKGPGSVMPAPRHGPMPAHPVVKKDDDDD